MSLDKSIKDLPQSAGIYQYFDCNGKLLYVGKAKNLFKRVKSYFNFTPSLKPNPNQSNRIIKMISQTASLSYIVVNSEHDALILENSLIKQLNPKYNILLRDDKTYPYIYIDTSLEYPRFDITRKIIDSKSVQYFGPYSVGAREIVNSLYELCKLVQKKGLLKSKKLCLYYQIGKCLGPCELNISKQEYAKELDLAYELIKNKKLLIKKLEQKMLFYAENLRFEEAKELRDTIQKIERSEIKSDIDFASSENYDIFAIQNSANKAVVLRMFMREGKIISSSHNILNIDEGYDEDELYQRVLLDFYQNEKPPIIAPILVASDFRDRDIIEVHLSKLFEKKTTIRVPKSSNKKDLIDLAILNCNELLRSDIKVQKKDNEVSAQIKELFELQKLPSRIEIFDNSHFFATATVGAMVVYEDGVFDKKSYRTYSLDAKDEYAQMRELLTRRIERFEKNPPPSLWILDGGETLLKLANDLLESSGINLDVIAISKEKVLSKTKRTKSAANDILYAKNGIFKLQSSDKRLHFVQKLRDEAHRCAINFHKKTKLKFDNESKLLSLNGISQAKIVKLLNSFGTFEAIKKAPLKEVASVLNLKDANTIKNLYN